MRTILNILNFILGGFATTLGWLLATLVSIILIVTAAADSFLLGNHSPFVISLR